MDSMQAAGFPRRPTRRGGRGRGRSTGSLSSSGVPTDHLKNLTNAMELGDHTGVKKHAFALIRSLPKAQQGLPRPNDANGAQGPKDAAQSGTNDSTNADKGVTELKKLPNGNGDKGTTNSGSVRLAAMLKGRRQPKTPKAVSAAPSGSMVASPSDNDGDDDLNGGY